MNKDLLFQLYAIHSESGNEKRMRKFIKRRIRRIEGIVNMEQDVHGNLFVTKGVSDTYPCLASHLDQVQHNHSKDFQCIEGDDVVFGYSARAREQQGLGADDKNGIYICLECLERYDVLKCAFFVEEETGCRGSGACDLSFFADCRYIVQPDRRDGNDLITSMMCGEVCSTDFINALDYKAFGYKEAQGSVTDVGVLVERGVGISCLNLSCGYYEAHTDCEFTVLSELENCLDFVCHIIDSLTDVYPFEHSPWYGSYGGKKSKSFDWDKYYDSYFMRQYKHKEAASYSAYYYDGFGSYYDDGLYDEDVYMMEQLIRSKKDITFEEVRDEWGMNFYTTDMDILNEIFTDTKLLLSDDVDTDVTEESIDDLTLSDVVFPVEKKAS